MVELIKFEIGKIFSKKMVWVLLLAVLWSMGSSIYRDARMLKFNGIKNKEEVQQIVSPYEGEVLTKERIKEHEDYEKKLRKKDNLSAEEFVLSSILNFDYNLDIDPDYVVGDREYKKSELKKDLDKLNQEGKTDTFEYKNMEYIYNLIDKKEAQTYHYKMEWIYGADFQRIAPFLSILVIVGIATIFSSDYQNNTVPLVLSSKLGKNKLITSKILSSLIFSTIIFIFVNCVFLSYIALDKFKGWNQALNSLRYFEATPYNITVIQYYIRGLMFSFIGIILFTLLVMLISLLVKNNILSMLISLGIYSVPVFICSFMPTKQLAIIFRQLNLEELISVEALFRNTDTYNIFGNPVLYANLLVTISLILIPIVTYMIIHFGKKQAI
ncbi:ABC transporter permease subunit [Romboutsia lituseburensis]|uniref:ABC transporter permease subunit n=1 Tax=Romboutsia lituseburensis TaxID=1537 RepID=UPI00215B141F|nr:ABC transporter permease subunit [Romboutsia lituseburensis]MCR8746662.1 ABC transporter permease subunit [Romboutsia lituseburensis]